MRSTIEERLLEADGRPSGFDYMRLALALAVFMLHIPATNFGDEVQNALFLHLWRPVSAIVLPMFFALSGFLVAGSLTRCKTLVSFLGLRVLRIVPALAAEVFLSGFILGALFTTLPLRRYFFSWGLLTYFLNIVGDVQFTLPGVFYSNPHAGVVNQQLWTVPWELDCYILLAVLALVGIVRKPIILVGTIVVIC